METGCNMIYAISISMSKTENQRAKMSPTRFTKLLRKNRLSQGQRLQGKFRAGTIEWDESPVMHCILGFH